MRPRASLLILALLAAAPPCRALFFTGALNQSFGRNNYWGVGGWADFGSDLHLRPSFDSYRFDGSHGTFRRYGARLGYDLPFVGLGVSGAAVPKTDGYDSYTAGADAVLSISPGGSGPVRRIKGSDQGGGKARGKGLARVDVSAGVGYTRHRDELDAARSVRSSALELGQTELNAGIGVSFLSNLISLDYTHSEYSKKDLAGLGARPPRFVTLQGVAPVLQEFPKNSVHLKGELGMLPVFHPYAGYARSTFEDGSPDSKAYTVGAYAELLMLEVTGFFQRYVRAGAARDESFYGLGASLRF